jgi:replicative DNA helicase
MPEEYNYDAEAAVLGGVLINNTVIKKVRSILNSDDFYEHRHKLIFAAFEDLDNAGTPIDVITVYDLLKKSGYHTQVGGAFYITELTNVVPTTAHIETYSKMVSDYAAMRKIKKVAATIDKASNNGTLEETLEIVKNQIHDVNSLGGKQNKYQVSSMLDYIDEAEETYKNRDKMQGLSTGFPSIDKLTMGLVGGELIIIAGETSRGKQQRCSEIIPTPNGDTRFGDIKVGDYVFGSNGKPTEVTGVFPQGIMPIYRVHFSDGSYLDTGKDHLWTLQRKDRPDMVRTSGELMGKLPSSKYHIPSTKPLEYKDEYEPIPAYELGMYIADGSHQGQIHITKSKGAISDYLQELDGELIRYDHPNTCGYLRARSDSKIVKYLTRCGLAYVKSGQKFIPKEWFTKTYDVRLRLLRGLMDGDGSYVSYKRAKHGTTMYHSTSYTLIEDIMRLATSVGWIARKGVVKHRKGNYYRITLHSTNFTNPFLKSVEANQWSPLDKEVKRSVAAVEIIGEDAAMCISVAAEDQLYVADVRFHIVTHNTLLAMHIVNNIAKVGHRVLFVTLEMTKAQLTSRYMYANGGPHTSEFATVAANTIFQENYRLNWRDIDGLIENAKEQLDVDIVVIDHLHYFARNLKNPSEELGEITMTFADNAKKYDIPIILISHTRRLGDGEQLSGNSLRGSSLIAQDSDIVLMVNRDPETNKMGILIDKNRNRGKLSDRTKIWGSQTERELNTVYLEFNNTKLHDPLSAPRVVQEIFPGSVVVE